MGIMRTCKRESGKVKRREWGWYLETVIKKQGVWEGEEERMRVVFEDGNKEAESVRR